MLTKKQKQVFDFIKDYIKQEGISPTQREIKEFFDLKSFGSVQRYLKYLKDAGLLTYNWNSKRGIELIEEINTSETGSLEIPLLGDIAAGLPIEVIENSNETISIPQQMVKSNKKLFGLNVCGDSMIEKGILDGDLAIIEYSQNFNQGDIVAAIVGEEATLKIFKKENSNIYLVPANKKYKTIKVQEELRIAGKLIGIIRSY